MRELGFSVVVLSLIGPAWAHDGLSAGEPAGAGVVTRTVHVEISDSGGRMAFAPDHLDVERGAAVRFVVHNGGAQVHEFVIGDAKANTAHKAMMERMPDMRHDDANAKAISPGATATLVWRFSHTGKVEFACLLPGHYEAGMHGVVTVK